MSCWVMMGLCSPAQISALLTAPAALRRTSAMAQSTSSAACEAGAISNSPSTVSAPSGGSANGRIDALSCAVMVALEWWSMVPAPQVTSSALTAFQAWPKVSAMTATPGGVGTTLPPAGNTAMPITPGMARTAAALLTDTTVPRMVGGRRTIVGIAPGTAWSSVNFLRPVTMSRASSRAWRRPTTDQADAALGSTPAGTGSSDADAVSEA